MSKSNNLGVEKIGNLKTKLNVEHSFEIKKFKNSSFQLSTEEPLHENNKDFELEKNKNEIYDDSDCMTNFNENTLEDSTKVLNSVGESKSQLYDSIDIDVDELLDKTYHEKTNPNKKTPTKDESIECKKTMLVDVCKNHFDVLPENWIEGIHRSGMPIYLHKKTRVVTLSRPYFLGPGDPKSHLAPLSAISCLQYKKSLETKERTKNELDLQINNKSDMILPNGRIETAQENMTKESLSHEELRKYCQSIFKFKKVNVPIEKTSQYTSSEDTSTQKNTKERPSLPASTKLISFPVKSEYEKQYRERIMNPNGKSYVCILYEYLQQALHTQPLYDFKSTEDPTTNLIAYTATVTIDNVQYGIGFGGTKKQAKLEASKATLGILIPEMKNITNLDQQSNCNPAIFDQIKVTDPRVIELSAIAKEPRPYNMLLVCLQRNFVKRDIEINYKHNNRRGKLHRCTMKVGKYTASVICKTKKEGKQTASQVILGLLHPHIDNWGSLLQLYGRGSIKKPREKKLELREITILQRKTNPNQPNYDVLNKLKEEMLKVRDQRRSKDTNTHSLITSYPYTNKIQSPQSKSNDQY